MVARVLLTLSACLFVLGCGFDPQDRIVGVWSADAERSEVPSLNNPDLERAAKFGLNNCLLKVRSDRTFVFTSGFTAEGTWTMSNNKLEMEVKSKGGRGGVPGMPSHLTGTFNERYDRIEVLILTFAGPVKISMKKSA